MGRGIGILICGLIAAGCGSSSGKSIPTQAAPGSTAPGTTAPSAGAPAVPAPAAPLPAPATPPPIAPTPIVGPPAAVGFNVSGPALPLLDDVQLYINLGDSLADGANAPSGQGYRDLLFRNQGFATYAGHDITSRWPGARFVQNAKSGAQSGEVVQRALGALSGWPVTTAGGDVIVTVSMGGNDVNDEVATMLFAPVAQAKAAALEANYQRLIDGLKQKYDDPAQGRRLVVIGLTVYDPTDGTGRIPAGLTNGFCAKIARMSAIGPSFVGNLDFYNDAIRRVLAANQGYVADDHVFFLGHGMSSPSPWFSNDCAHANGEGHHQIRRNVWRVITGQLR